jgi:hypothetical protein
MNSFIMSECFLYLFITFRNTTTPTSCWTDKISGNDVGKLHKFFVTPSVYGFCFVLHAASYSIYFLEK